MSNFLTGGSTPALSPRKFFKTTLWQGEHIMLGLNCLEPGQIQKVHAHDGADKVYYVLEGEGNFTIGDEQKLLADRNGDRRSGRNSSRCS